mgnify:CR=1 FL=1
MKRGTRMLQTGAIVTLGLCGVASVAAAQSMGDFKKLEVQDITAPATPAFVLLGASPPALQYS